MHSQPIPDDFIHGYAMLKPNEINWMSFYFMKQRHNLRVLTNDRINTGKNGKNVIIENINDNIHISKAFLLNIVIKFRIKT